MSRLLDDETLQSLPALYTSEEVEDPMVHLKLFTPWTNWTWYVIEFDGDDVFFGLVDGHELELGYFTLSELESIRGPGGLRIERDEHFEAKPLSAVREGAERTRRGFGPRGRSR
ncbi:MAG: DUF2958 domain-containing protein [Phycisphaerales bacterium]|nr:DUF2958 domain-containing protein [Phycisphaerales bacterium]